MKCRRFRPDEPTHICRRSKTHSAIFYCLEDCLVYFTVFCTDARRFGIKVMALALMYDHIHQTIRAGTKEHVASFQRRVATDFSKEFYSDLYNGTGTTPGHGIDLRNGTKVSIPRGSLFEIPYLSAPKLGAKNVRSNLAYVYNNPVERHIKGKAIEWRWNFLAYSQSDYPFSEKFVIRNASLKMRRSVAEVKGCLERGEYLRHVQLRRLFYGLGTKEKRQLIDFIISNYNVVDYSCLARYYGSIERAIIAIDANTGSEYDFTEERYSNPDTAYGEMIRFVEKHGYVNRTKEVVLLPLEKRYELKRALLRYTIADEWQASKFLWLDLPPRHR